MDDNSSQISQKPKINLLIAVLLVITFLSLCYTVLLAYQNNKFKLLNKKGSGNNIIIPTIISTSPTQEESKLIPTSKIEEYKTAKYGRFSYEYPVGWHVAELWQDTSREGIIIAMDPNPISTAPRGGPLATFEIRLINGQPNPNEIFSEEMSKFNQENYTDITKETIKSDLGPIYHYRGKINGEMLGGEPMESYYLTFETNKNDPSNQQVIIATMALKSDSKLSEMFRHVILSIKKLN